MSATQDMNGIVRYVSVVIDSAKAPPRENTPPLASKFLGEPQVTVDVHSNGRVDFFVTQPVQIGARKVTVNDIWRVKVSRSGRTSVMHYPKPVGLTNDVGPKAPFLWPSVREVPEEVRGILVSATPGLCDEATSKNERLIVNALMATGITSKELGMGSKLDVPSKIEAPANLAR